MIVKGKDISAEAVQWSGWNTDEILSVFGEGHIFFGYGNDSVYVSFPDYDMTASPSDYLVRIGDEIFVFCETLFNATFNASYGEA